MTEQKKEIKISKYDANALKRTLDDSVISFISNEANYAEDHTLSNRKLVVMVVCVALALTAQFYPAPFPDNYWVLVVCCSSYFVLSNIVLQYQTYFLEKDYIMFTLPKDGFSLQIRSSLPRFQYDYTLAIGKKGASTSEEVISTNPVGNYFDENGVFIETAFHSDVRKLVASLESKKRK